MRLNSNGKYWEGMRLKPNHKNLAGYRLPSEGEWEYACRAGAVTSRFYGETGDLLARYAWYDNANSREKRLQPVGSLMPNDLGLFDMLGNALEWTEDRFTNYLPKELRPKIVEEEENIGGISGRFPRVLRGGSVTQRALFERSAQRLWSFPNAQGGNTGFRVARTL